MNKDHGIALLMVGSATTLMAVFVWQWNWAGVIAASSILGLIVAVVEFAISRFVSKDGW